LLKPVTCLTAPLTHSGTGIGHINVVDYVAAAGQPAISRLPTTDPNWSVIANFDGWVLPKRGLVFVWVLDAEMCTVAARRRIRKT
jgi:hypothetical protein